MNDNSRTRRRWTIVLVASLAVLVAVPALLALGRATWAQGQRPSEVALDSVAADAPAPPAPAPATAEAPAETEEPGASGEEAAAPATPAVGTRSARLEDLPPPAEAVPPAFLRAPSVGIDAPVDAVSVEQGSTAMEVPEDASRVGWYRFGPGPGDPEGVTVVTAHVDSRETGPGAFFRLRDLSIGDRVDVALADGSVVAYEVSGREQVGKSALPVDELFRRDGAPGLALVTCGGDFDRTAGRYTDNVIVWATPLPS